MANLVFTGTILLDGSVISQIALGNQIDGQIVGGPAGPQGDQGPQGDPGVVQAVVASTGIDVDDSDVANPEVALSSAAQASLALADSAVQDLSDLGVTASATELNYTDGVTSAIQTQLDAKVPTSRTINGNALSSNVTLDADDIDDTSTTNKFVTASDVTNLGNLSGTNTGDQDISGIATNASAITDLDNNKQDILSEGAFVNGDKTKLDGIETAADVTDATNVDAAGATMNADTTLAGNGYFLDEDNMASDDATKVPSQQSVKAYQDNELHKGPTQGSAGWRNKYLANWYTAMATARTTPVDIVTVGDSIAGSIFNTSSLQNNRESWSAKIANRLNRRIGITTATTGFLYALGDSAAPSMTETTGANPSPVQTYGIGGWSAVLENGEYVRQESSMDGISIMYSKKSDGGTMRIRDGGAAGTILADIDTSAASLESGHIWTSDALTYESHNIYIENIDAATEVVVEACYVHSGTRDKGFRVWQAAHGGFTTAAFNSNPQIAIDQIERMQPALVITATGTNDDIGNIQSRTETLLDNIQTASPNSDILMWIPFVGSTCTSDDLAVLRAVAEDYNLAYIDSVLTVGAINQSGNPLSYDGIHPNENGRTVIADQIYGMIGGDPIGYLNRMYADNRYNPLFLGTSYLNGDVHINSGKFFFSNFFGTPYALIKTLSSDTAPVISLAGGVYNNLAYGVNKVGLWLGAGGSTVADTGLYRDAADTLKTDDMFQAGRVVVADITGTSDTIAAADLGKILRYTDSSKVTVTLPDGLPVGSQVNLLFWGAAGGAVQDNGTSTVQPEGDIAQYKEVSCVVVATDTWSVQGEVT